MNNVLYGNEFDLQDNEHARKTHVHIYERLGTKTPFETD